MAMQAAKSKTPAVVIALVLVLAIAVAAPAVATIPAADRGLVDLELVTASPATSPLLPPTDLPVARLPPAHAPPAARLEAAPNHHLRVALAVAVARLSACPQAENRIRGRAAAGAAQHQQNQLFSIEIAPGVCDGPSMYQGFGNSPLNYSDPLGLRVGLPEVVPGSPAGTAMVEGFKGAFDSSNPWWARGALFVAAVATLPVAGVEGALNFPFHVDVGTDRAAHRIAEAHVFEDDPLERTRLYSQAVGDLAFLTAEGIAIGLPGANAAASPVAQGVSRTAGAVNRAVNPMRWFDDVADATAEGIRSGARGLIPESVPGGGRLLPIDEWPRTVFSGHGGYFRRHGFVTIPDGTTLTVYAEHDRPITSGLAHFVERNLDVPFNRPRTIRAGSAIGAKTYLPGAVAPNYHLAPPGELWVVGNPVTVARITTLREFFTYYRGHCHWASCLDELGF